LPEEKKEERKKAIIETLVWMEKSIKMVAIPLSLHFAHHATGRKAHNKQFYWKLWYGNDEMLPNIEYSRGIRGPGGCY